MITVHFNYENHGLSEEVFFQPLFFLAQVQKHAYLKKQGLKYTEEMINDDLVSLSHNNEPMQWEISPTCRKDEEEIIMNYTLNRYKGDHAFMFAGAKFHIKFDNQNKKIVKVNDHPSKHGIYTTYEITYPAEDVEKFEKFIKTSMKYYLKFYLGFKKEHNKIKIFINNDGGSYFDSLGSRPKRSLDTIYFPKKQKEAIMADLNKFLDPKTKRKYADLGIPYKRTYLFEGEMGSGKTSLISAIASQIGYNIAIVSFSPKMTETNLMRMMRSLNEMDDDELNKENNNTIIVFEDMDCIFQERKKGDELRTPMSLSGILNALDGISTNHNSIIIITTQFMKNMDSALIRPGRIDYILHFDYVVKEQVMEIYRKFTQCDDEKKINKFYEEFCELNIKTSACLLQQYLLQYIDEPDKAIEHLDDMKIMYNRANISPKVTEETGLYN